MYLNLWKSEIKTFLDIEKMIAIKTVDMKNSLKNRKGGRVC